MYLGIDLGTSGVKVLLADPGQKIIASEIVPLTISRPRSGWFEQNPADWIAATRQALSQVRSRLPGELLSVRAIGLSGQMHGATLLDRKDHVIRPCILWNDTRSYQEAAELDSQPRFQQLSGNIVFPGFTAPKIQWLRKHEAEQFDKVAKVLLPKDYLRLWLTGEYVSDMSDASGTSWLDVSARRWSEELLAVCGLETKNMPSLVDGSEVSGQIRHELARELGLNRQVIVAGGAGDNAASAMATGTIIPGSGFISIGTSGVLFAANDHFSPNPQSAVHAFCHALPGRWHQMGVILSASAALKWYAGIVGASEETLTSELGSTLLAPRGALFLPYLSGERTPHNDAMVRGSFHGLGSEMNRQSLTQSVLEGVAFAFRDNLEALKLTGTELQSVVAVGGGMNSGYWMQVMATVLNLPVEIPQDGDFGAALGAVRLAMLADAAAGLAEVCSVPPIRETIMPTESLQAEYEHAYQKFRDAYRNSNLSADQTAIN